MRFIVTWILRHPFIAFLFALLITLFFASKLPQIKIDTSANSLIIKDSPEAHFYEESKKKFGDDNTLSIIYKASDVFNTAILQSIEDLTYETEEIDGVTRVISLFTVNNLNADEDGFLNTDALIPQLPETEKELAQIRENALANDLIHGEVVNTTGTVAAIQLSIRDRPDDPLFSFELAQKIESLLEDERDKLGDGVELYQIGNLIIANTMMTYIQHDMGLVIPLSLAVIFIVLFGFFRSVMTVILPMVTGGCSIVVTLGIMALLDFAINPISLIVPSLLLIIGSTEDIHILAEYEEGIRSLKEKTAAIKHMAMRTGLVVFFTAFTTFAGFITLGPNPIPIISEFGIATGLGIIANFILTLLIAPPLLSRVSIPKSFLETKEPFLHGVSDYLVTFVLNQRKLISIFCVVFIVLSSTAATFIVSDSNYLNFFREDAPIRKLVDDVNKNLSGANAFFVVIDTQELNGVRQSNNLQAIAKLTDYLDKRYEKVISYDRFIRKTNQEMNGGDTNFFTIPDENELISQYTLLMQPSSLERFVDFDFQYACIIVRTDMVGSAQLNEELAEIQQFIDTELPSRLNVNITGGSVLVAKASDQISNELIFNLLLMSVVIFFVISTLFISFKAGLLAMIPNSIPVIGTFGVMGLLGIPLSTGTFPIVVIALGIAVDDTIHFMVNLAEEMKHTSNNEVAVAATIRHEFKPILSTSAALIIGFWALMPAEFGSISEFGFLSGIAILLALIADLVVTPVLLLTVPLITYWDLLRVSIKEDIIDTSPLLQNLKPKEVKKFILLGTLMEEKSGHFIMKQGDKDNAMLLLLEGSLEVSVRDVDGEQKTIGEIQPGQIVGEMSLLSNEPRSASVQAKGDVQILRIDAEILERVNKKYPRLATKIYQNISQILAGHLKNTTQNYIEALK